MWWKRAVKHILLFENCSFAHSSSVFPHPSFMLTELLYPNNSSFNFELRNEKSILCVPSQDSGYELCWHNPKFSSHPEENSRDRSEVTRWNDRLFWCHQTEGPLGLCWLSTEVTSDVCTSPSCTPALGAILKMDPNTLIGFLKTGEKEKMGEKKHNPVDLCKNKVTFCNQL